MSDVDAAAAALDELLADFDSPKEEDIETTNPINLDATLGELLVDIDNIDDRKEKKRRDNRKG